MKYPAATLSEVIEINPDSVNRNYPFSSFRYIDISSVGSGDLTDLKLIPITAAPSRAKRLIKPGDTILATVRPNLRSFYHFKEVGENTIVSTGFAVLRPTTIIDPRYLYYSVTNQAFTDYLTNNAKGAAYPAVDTEIILRGKIPLPPLPTQRKIVAILSAYDDLIENNTRRIRILEEMAQAIYREWFVEFRYPGHEDVPLVESPLGPIPQGWEVGYFTDVIDVLSGGTPTTSIPEYWGQDIPWFTPQDLSGNFYVLDTTRKITALGLSKCTSKLYPSNTVFITARGTVGKCALAAVPMAMSQTSYALLGKNSLSQFFIYLLALSLVEHLKQQATGAVFDTIIVDTFRKIRLAIPPNSLIDRFHLQVEIIFQMTLNLQRVNINLRQQRDLLLPRLISGELDVESLDLPISGTQTTLQGTP